MISLKLCRITLIRFLIALVIISSFLSHPGFCQESEDSQIFISGFNAYQQKDYAASIEKMSEVLQKYPDTPLRDMTLFWLSRAYFKNGNQKEAARFMSQFSKEYPDNPLKGTVEEELLTLTARYEKGETLPAGKPVERKADNTLKAKAEKELAKENAEQQRLNSEKAGQIEQERVAVIKAAEERKAAELQLQAQAKTEQELAAAETESARLSIEKQEQERLAALKVQEERKAIEKAEQEKLAQARIEQEQAAAAKAKEEQLAAAKAMLINAENEQERLAALKVEEERKAAEKSEQDKLAQARIEQEQTAAIKAKEEQLVAAEAARITAEKQEQARLAALKAENSRKAALLAEQERIAAVNAEEERIAAAARKSEEKQVAELARLTAAKQDQERRAAEKSALEAEAVRQTAVRQEQERRASVQSEEQRLAKQRQEEEKTLASKALMREKAIAQFKSIIEKYPHTSAATTAAAKLQELGITVALPTQTATAVPTPDEQPENAQVLRLEVAQFSGFEFKLLATSQTYEVARRISIPFEIINRGNGNDSFYLESGFPLEFNATFASAAALEQAINQTPELTPDQSFRGVVNLVIPADSIDGLRIIHPVKAASRFMSEATQSRELKLIASAPLLRAVIKTDKMQPLPGDKVVYRIAILNVGSTSAQNVTLRLNFPPQMEPINYAEAGFKQEMKAALVLEGLKINSGESKELTVTLQLKDDSLAGQELLARAELINNPLKTTATFVSNTSIVQPQHGIVVRSGSERLIVIPGQTVTIPFVITNTGNVREKIKITAGVKGVLESTIFHDLNRDGSRQSNEPVITEIGPLEPREETNVVMEIKTAKNAADGSDGNAQVTFSADGDVSKSAVATATLLYSRPVLMMTMAGRDGQLKPEEIASFDLVITNRGSNLARIVELMSAWPDQLELVAAEPVNSSVTAGNVLWNFQELGAGEKRTIRVSFRVKAGIGKGTNIQVKNILKYEDQLGNRY